MAKRKVAVMIFILFGLSELSHSWFFRKTESKKEQSAQTEIPTEVPFEMKISDEKFLMQADFIKDLSPLEACHHLVSITNFN